MIDEKWQLCTKRDDFIWDRAVWIAELEDGTEVWQDDDRPGVEEPSAWIRLGNYVTHSQNRISKLHLRFRSNVIRIDPSTKYYFTRGILNGTGMKRQRHFACVGIYDDEQKKFHVDWYSIPELVVGRKTVRSLEDIHGPEVIEGSDV